MFFGARSCHGLPLYGILALFMPDAPFRHRFATDPHARRRFAFAALGVFALLGWGSLLFFSDLLSVRTVTVEEGKAIDALEAKAAVFQSLDRRDAWRPWPARHMWFIDEAGLAEQLKARWYAESVEVHTGPVSNIVRLIIKEQRTTLLVKTPGQFLRVDAQGIVRAELTPEERLAVLQRLAGRADSADASTEALIELPDLNDPVALRYRLPMEVDELRRWFAIDTELRRIGLAVSYMRVEPQRLALYGRDGIPSYIDPLENVPAQLKALSEFRARVKAGKIPPAKEFVDARILGRLYVK